MWFLPQSDKAHRSSGLVYSTIIAICAQSAAAQTISNSPGALSIVQDPAFPSGSSANAAVLTVRRAILALRYGANADSTTKVVRLGLTAREADLWGIDSGCSSCFTATGGDPVTGLDTGSVTANSTAFTSRYGSTGTLAQASFQSAENAEALATTVGLVSNLNESVPGLNTIYGSGGSFGLGFTGLSTIKSTSIFEQFISQTEHATAGLALAPDVASLSFGSIDRSKFSDVIQWIPTYDPSQTWIDSQLTYWQIGLNGVGINEKSFAISSLVAIIDPSSPFIYLPEEVTVPLYQSAGFNISRPSPPRTTDPGFFYIPCKQSNTTTIRISIGANDYSFDLQSLPLAYGSSDDQTFNSAGMCVGNLVSTSSALFNYEASLATAVLGMPFLETVYTVFNFTAETTGGCTPPAMGFAPITTSSNITSSRKPNGHFTNPTIPVLASASCDLLPLRNKKSTSQRSGLNVNLLVAVVAPVAAVIILAICAFLWWRHHSKRKREAEGKYQPANSYVATPRMPLTPVMPTAYAPNETIAEPERPGQNISAFANLPAANYKSTVQGWLSDEKHSAAARSPRSPNAPQNPVMARIRDSASSFGTPHGDFEQASQGNTLGNDKLHFTPSLFSKRASEAYYNEPTDGKSQSNNRDNYSASFYPDNRTTAHYEAPSRHPFAEKEEELRPDTFYERPFSTSKSMMRPTTQFSQASSIPFLPYTGGDDAPPLPNAQEDHTRSLTPVGIDQLMAGRHHSSGLPSPSSPFSPSVVTSEEQDWLPDRYFRPSEIHTNVTRTGSPSLHSPFEHAHRINSPSQRSFSEAGSLHDAFQGVHQATSGQIRRAAPVAVHRKGSPAGYI